MLSFRSSGKYFLFLFAASLCFYYTLLCSQYLMTPMFYDHIEPSIIMEGESFRNGFPIYTPQNDSSRISFGFGPMPYMTAALFLSIIDDPIIAGKLSGILPAISGVILLTAFIWRTFSLSKALTSLSYILVMFMPFGHLSFWNRPESTVIFGCSLTAIALFLENRIYSSILFSLGTAIAMNGRATSYLYILPLFAMFCIRSRRKHIILLLLLSALLTFIPFILFSSLDLMNYIFWLLNTLHRQLIYTQILRSLLYGILFTLPLILIIIKGWKNRNTPEVKPLFIILTSLLFSLLLMAFVAAKEGSGSHHLIPFAIIIGLFIPVFMDGFDLNIRDIMNNKFHTAALLIWLTIISYQCITGPHSRFVNFLFSDRSQVVVSDLLILREKYKNHSMTMGYTDNNPDNYKYTFFRPLLMRNSRTYFLDAPAIMDMAEAGIKMPVSTADIFRQQKYDIFILPRNGTPFSMKSFFATKYPLFTSELSAAFSSNYRKADSSRYYYVYFARNIALAGIQ